MGNLCDKVEGSLMAQVVQNLCVDKLKSTQGKRTRLVSVLFKNKNIADLVRKS